MSIATVMLLAAGRGERMRPLTDQLPKPLLQVAGKPLVVHHIERLAAAGFKRFVINHAWHGQQIEAVLGDGSTWNINIRYSPEGEALETGGGILRALPWLSDPFLVVNSDIWMQPDYVRLKIGVTDLIHLLMVANPPHHSDGDFYLEAGRLQTTAGGHKHTFSGIGLYRKELFGECRNGRFPLAPLLRRAIDAGRAGGQLYKGLWLDVGTPERLRELENLLRVTAHN